MTAMLDRIVIHTFPCFQHPDPCVGIVIRFNIQRWRWRFGSHFTIVLVSLISSIKPIQHIESRNTDIHHSLN